MYLLSLMGVVNPLAKRNAPPPNGFCMPAYRYRGYGRDNLIVVPQIRDDRVAGFCEYNTRGPGCGPVWSNDRLTGASYIQPLQPALYAYKFPHGTVYVAVRELMKAELRNWAEQHMMETPEEMLIDIRTFCGNSLPASLTRQIDALLQRPPEGHH